MQGWKKVEIRMLSGTLKVSMKQVSGWYRVANKFQYHVEIRVRYLVL